MDEKIRFKKNIKEKKIENEPYEIQEFSLMINNKFFDPDTVTKHSKSIKRNIHKVYWEKISSFFFNGATMIVRLGGLHSDLDDIKRTLGKAILGRNIIFHHHRWITDLSGAYDDEKFALIECDRKLFKKLFDKYWFALGFEFQFEGFVISPKDVPYLEKWSRRAEGESKIEAIVKKSLLYFDNQTNGFHYRIIKKSKQSRRSG